MQGEVRQRGGKTVDCCQWEVEVKCTRRDACSFRHDSSKHGASTRSSSPTPKSLTNNDGKHISKGRPPRGSSPSGKRLQKPCKDYFKGKCTNPSRVSTLQITVRLQAWRKVFVLTQGDGPTAEENKDEWRKKGQLHLLSVKQCGVCIFQMQSHRKSDRFDGGAPIH